MLLHLDHEKKVLYSLTYSRIVEICQGYILTKETGDFTKLYYYSTINGIDTLLEAPLELVEAVNKRLREQQTYKS